MYHKIFVKTINCGSNHYSLFKMPLVAFLFMNFNNSFIVIIPNIFIFVAVGREPENIYYIKNMSLFCVLLCVYEYLCIFLNRSQQQMVLFPKFHVLAKAKYFPPLLDTVCLKVPRKFYHNFLLCHLQATLIFLNHLLIQSLP